MYSSIRISSYRGLGSFRLDRLGRVNLLVGRNDCGKTSILECVELLRSPGNPQVLGSILGRRGELRYLGDEDPQAHLDITRLFANRDLRSEVLVEADRVGTADPSVWNNKVEVSASDNHGDECGSEEKDRIGEDRILDLRLSWSDAADEFKARITSEGFLPFPSRTMRVRNEPHKGVQFIGPNGMSAMEAVRHFDELVFTENEEHVIQALRIVNPKVERIATVVTERWSSFHEAPSGVFLKLRGAANRAPIESAGDGMWRMLGLSLALANAKGGVLLVDKIDTGFHYSIMGNMWRMVNERASALDVQVFATTHSRDCYQSLATIVGRGTPSVQVTIQRIDPRREQAVEFSDDDIIVVAERGIEVR